MLRKRITVPVAIALAVLAGPALAGCSVHDIVEKATGGKVDLPGRSVPSDFPKEVPLAKGEVLLGGAVGDGKGSKAWNVTIAADGAQSFDAVKSQLEGAGFTASEGVGGSTADGGTGTFENANYGVLVVVAKADDRWSVNYTVTTKDQG